jgi:hypothetical protein
MASETPIEINLIPVFKVMDFYKIPESDKLYCMRLIQNAYHASLKVALSKRKK